MPPRTSDSDGRERVTLVPDQVLGPQDINSVREQQLREGVEDAGMRVAEVMDSLSPDGMRKSFAGMWSPTLRVKITGRDGIVKLNVSIPVCCSLPFCYISLCSSRCVWERDENKWMQHFHVDGSMWTRLGEYLSISIVLKYHLFHKKMELDLLIQCNFNLHVSTVDF